MTLFKQMAIAISFIIVILLASVMAINYQSSKKDMIQNLYETTVNNISTLTSKLAEAGEENAMIITTVDSEFDSGYYKMIDFKSTDGTNDYLQIDNEPVEGIPTWFINFTDIKLEPVTADVSSGWTILGTVTVAGDTGVVYKALYKMFLNLSFLFALSVAISLIILNILLRFILKPLKDIELLSKNISQGKFETIEKLPSTLELKNVSVSMNDMSSKIKNMITKLNKNLEKITDQLSKDDLTGLDLEQSFNTDMKQMFIKKEDGYVFSVKVDNFGDFAKNNTNSIVDEFLKDYANALRKSDKDIQIYRFFGSTFAMISKKTNHQEIIDLTRNLKDEFIQLSRKYGLESVGHIGVTPFNPISTIDDIFEFANKAYNEAKQLGANEFYIRDKKDLEKDMLIWKELVADIIYNSKFNVAYTYQALSMDGNKTILHEETFTSATSDEGKTIPIGTFISVAEKFDMIIDFDKAIVNKVIKHIKDKDIKHEILINLAFDSLIDDNFKLWLKDILQQDKVIASQLVFSMTAYGCVRDIEVFKNFVEFIHQNGSKIILKRFETKFIPLDTLKELNLDYIRLAKDYTGDISSDPSKQSFVESICELSKLLNIKVFSENAKDDDDFNRLKELGIYGAGLKDILKYEGELTQGIISHCMKDIENNIVNMGIMPKIATITVELLQNMMNYSKSEKLESIEIKPAGFIEIKKDKEYRYYVNSKNIINQKDKEKIEPILLEIQTLDNSGVRKRYRELRKSGENTHSKGGGIGFFEIAKVSSSLEYKFTAINEDKYYFEFKVSVDSEKKKKEIA
ncbi:MAG: SiaB family protein kinase [Campylobacterota bacterium]|nr:SiaB family protein kinase [Campylobacterota bacterium]